MLLKSLKEKLDQKQAVSLYEQRGGFPSYQNDISNYSYDPPPGIIVKPQYSYAQMIVQGTARLLHTF